MIERAVPGFLPSVHGLHFANRFEPGPTVRLGRVDPRAVGIGDAASGLCGGMALTARDLWAAGVAAPDDARPPVNGSRRFQALVRSQVVSLDWLRVPLRYALLALLHAEPPSGSAAAGGVAGAPMRRGRLRRDPVRVPTARREWPRVRAELDAGRPCLLELIRVGGFSPATLIRNHQVLAWAYAADEACCGDAATLEAQGGTIRLRVYDPNHPGDDGVEVELVIAPDRGRPSLAERITLRQNTGERLLGFFRGPCPPRGPVDAWR